jgi:hypothetical protein
MAQEEAGPEQSVRREEVEGEGEEEEEMKR